jgi:hypothetical protein
MLHKEQNENGFDFKIVIDGGKSSETLSNWMDLNKVQDGQTSK